jgi:hypothetical protein
MQFELEGSLMLDNREMRASLEYTTDAEVKSAIRYLDPDLDLERTRARSGAAFGICITSLTIVTGVLTFVFFYFSKL